MLSSVKILDNDEGDARGSKHRSISHANEQYNVVKDSVGNEPAGDARLTAECNNLPEGSGEPKVVSGVGKREEWMEHPQAAWENSYSRQDVKRQETQPQESKEEVSTRYIDPSSNHGSNTPFSVGDGGASWRMKALKRAQVQAQVEGTSLTDVVQQRWGSVSELAASAERAAPMDAHHRSKKNRRNDRVAFMKGNMKRPKIGRSHESDRGGDKREYENLVKHAARHMNTFKDDGSFADQFKTAHQEERNERKVECSSGREPEHRDYETSKMEHRSEEPPVSQVEDRGRDNTSVAAMIRARLSGNTVQESLQKREDNGVILPMIDARGKAAPGAFGRETAVQAHGTRDHKKKLDRFQDGKKSRYFADDDDVDLDTMVKRSKHGDEEEMDAVMARNIAKRTHFKGNEFNVDDEYEFDAGLEFLESSKISKRGRQRGREKEELARKEKAKQVREYKSMSRALERCRLCLNSHSRKKHLMVSVGTCAYLALPEKGRLVTGHCCVVPTEHIPSARAADENTWEEMRNFKKCVLQMFSDRGKHCIFIETVLDVDPLTRSHAIVECIPVSESVAAKAPMYFKKAIDDATNDWSQHAAKTCIETESRHLQKKIPANFPYVHIEFGLAAGVVHVIDNPKEFDPLFARRVLVGLMGLPEEDMHGRLSKEGETVQRQWVDEFQKAYTAYDWVPQLHHT